MWTFTSTNAKEIGTLYLIFAVFAGIKNTNHAGLKSCYMLKKTFNIKYMSTFGLRSCLVYARTNGCSELVSIAQPCLRQARQGKNSTNFFNFSINLYSGSNFSQGISVKIFICIWISAVYFKLRDFTQEYLKLYGSINCHKARLICRKYKPEHCFSTRMW